MGVFKGRTAQTWEWWGRRDPYFGVLTDEKFKSATLDLHREEFFRSGEMHVAGVLSRIEDRFGAVPRRSALDFGCGVGRVLIPLTGAFETVTGLDIAPSMLAEARQNLAARGIERAELLASDAELSALGDRRFDLIHSYIVLQHMAPGAGYRAIDRLLDHVTPEGAVFLHLSVRRFGAGWARRAYRLVNDLPGFYLLERLAKREKLYPPPMLMTEYDLGKVCHMLQGRGFVRMMVEFEQHGPNLTACLYGRRG
jgi:SAM-dependent methyltransferase